MCVYEHEPVRLCVHVNVHACVYACACMCVYVCAVHVCVGVCGCACACMCVCVRMYERVCVCTCILLICVAGLYKGGHRAFPCTACIKRHMLTHHVRWGAHELVCCLARLHEPADAKICMERYSCACQRCVCTNK